MNLWEKKMDQEITAGDIQYLKIRLSRETNYVEAAKLQKELEEKEELFNEQFIRRLKEIENDGTGVVGSR